MKNRNITYSSNILIISILLSGCLKDNINVPVSVDLESGAELLHYFEAQGDYINSNEVPSLVDATEVFANLTNYLIIDVRDSLEFYNGHIQGAKNLSNTELLNYLQSNDISSYNKIVIVSANGQSSAYYTCLLRLYGYGNIYTMNFGMAYWHTDFANTWLQKIKNSPNIEKYNNIDYPKGLLNDLPAVLEKSGKNIDEAVKQRIASFISRGFIDKMDFSDINMTSDIDIGNSMYFICYGIGDLYFQPARDGTNGHPPNSILYWQSSDFQSVKHLQTLPANQEILVYSYSGQLSAVVVAYLNVMGYQAKSLLYGACQLIYSRMAGQPSLNQYAFIPERINNFPYVAGR